MSYYVKIKIALSRDEVRIFVKILVGDQWAFVFRGGNNCMSDCQFLQPIEIRRR